MNILDLSKTTAVLDLTKAAPTLQSLSGVLSWEPHPVHGKSLKFGFDLDIFAFALATGKISGAADVAYHKNKSACGVRIPEDERSGGSEEVFVDLKNVPAGKDQIALWIFLHEADKRGQHMGMVANAKFVLSDAVTKEVIQEYRLTDFADKTAAHIGNLVRTATGWDFKPDGGAFVLNGNDVAASYL